MAIRSLIATSLFSVLSVGYAKEGTLRGLQSNGWKSFTNCVQINADWSRTWLEDVSGCTEVQSMQIKADVIRLLKLASVAANTTSDVTLDLTNTTSSSNEPTVLEIDTEDLDNFCAASCYRELKNYLVESDRNDCLLSGSFANDAVDRLEFYCAKNAKGYCINQAFESCDFLDSCCYANLRSSLSSAEKEIEFQAACPDANLKQKKCPASTEN